MRFTNHDSMLSRDELSIRAEIYKYSYVIVKLRLNALNAQV